MRKQDPMKAAEVRAGVVAVMSETGENVFRKGEKASTKISF